MIILLIVFDMNCYQIFMCVKQTFYKNPDFCMFNLLFLYQLLTFNQLINIHILFDIITCYAVLEIFQQEIKFLFVL